ncbi:hypothetical protein GU927_014235 [Rhodobacteraceae bacterium HSP-20]|uniref:Uncharacterized protein n=1 Tax=Paragemmobacter amnigenus TaxID=2852097 RepID=A0ABS6J5G5_9RHOB|nr:hypothetical protein [Rhodobacter amnigenus]MBU9699005.1 hypothetical protein [Rhodobacter amnigenus]MBV4390232.1 hypothetical protein [Rhodobacter amnigenus]
MSDPNMNDFYRRVGRIEQAHASGLAFEAEGTLGRSFYRRTPVRRRPVFRIGIFLLCFCFGLKGALHYHLGAKAYDDRVETIAARGGFDAVQAKLLQSEPVTRLISEGITLVVQRSLD